MVFINDLKKFLQVNNLVIAPIPDIRPRIIGLNGFPVEAVFGNPIWIVAIEGGSIQELENHTGNKFGIRMRQSFPVLKNIPPVTFVVQNFSTVCFIFNVYGKIIPRTARIAVPAAEFQRQILYRKPDQVIVIAFRHKIV